MKNMRRGILVLALLWITAQDVSAQYNIIGTTSADKKAEQPKIEVVLPPRIETHARYDALLRAERKARRQERNYFQIGGKLYFTQVSFNNWATEANNSINGRLEADFRHIYKTEKFNIESIFKSVYQIGKVDTQFRKLDDRLELNVQANYKFAKSWYYSSNLNFKSQYSPGYKYPNDSTVISRFMAPAYMILSLGANYMPENEKLSLSIAPISGKMTFVLDDTLSKQGKFGVDPGQKIKSELGAYLRFTWEKKFYKDIFRYRTIYTTFYNYKAPPVLGWENWLDIYLLKIFTVNFYYNVLYDRTAETPKKIPWQTNQSFGFGITYTFKSKPSP